MRHLRTYKFEVTIPEGGDEFWQGMQADGSYRGYATIKEVHELLEDVVESGHIFDVRIKPIGYEWKPSGFGDDLPESYEEDK